MDGWMDGWMNRWKIGRDSHATFTSPRRRLPCTFAAPYHTQMYMYQGAVSGEDVYIREGMAALAGWQGAACTASS